MVASGVGRRSELGGATGGAIARRGAVLLAVIVLWLSASEAGPAIDEGGSEGMGAR